MKYTVPRLSTINRAKDFLNSAELRAGTFRRLTGEQDLHYVPSLPFDKHLGCRHAVQ
jgi:hypothetical protein